MATIDHITIKDINDETTYDIAANGGNITQGENIKMTKEPSVPGGDDTTEPLIDVLGRKMEIGVDYVTAGRKDNTTAGANSTAEGVNNTASAAGSHAEGYNTVASHAYAHAEGTGTKTGADYQHVEGKYNVGKNNTLFEIGKGTADDARSNAFEVDANGNVLAAGNLVDGNGNALADKANTSDINSALAKRNILIYAEVSGHAENSVYISTPFNPSYIPIAGDLFLVHFTYGYEGYPTVGSIAYINSSTTYYPMRNEYNNASLNLTENTRYGLFRFTGTSLVLIAADYNYICANASHANNTENIKINGISDSGRITAQTTDPGVGASTTTGNIIFVYEA